MRGSGLLALHRRTMNSVNNLPLATNQVLGRRLPFVNSTRLKRALRPLFSPIRCRPFYLPRRLFSDCSP
jgi:hypothetical protein